MKTITRAGVLATLGGATVSALSIPARAQKNPTLRIGVSPIDNSAEPFYASDLGYFADAGLDVTIQEASNSNTLLGAIVGGALDIGLVNIDALATTSAHGVPLLAVAPAADYLYPETQNIVGILVRPNSPIHTAKDLNGKTIGVAALHSIGTTSISAWVDQNGGDSSTLQFIEIPFPAQLAALDQGRVDAIDPVVPFLNAGAKSNRLLVAGYNSIAKHFLVALWVARREWAEAHADLVSRFASIMHRTAVWANAHQAESGAILAKHSKIPANVIATMVRAHYAIELTPNLLQPGIDASAKYNGFKSFRASELLLAPRS